MACPSCGKRNRLPVAAGGKPSCGSCHAKLPWVVDAGDGTFDAAVDAPMPVVVDLWAPWCGPCRTLSPTLEALAAERAGDLKVVKVNVDEAPALSRRFQVQSIPMLLLMVGGEVVSRQIGAVPGPALASWIDSGTRAA
jgi:thioredoxin 2